MNDVENDLPEIIEGVKNGRREDYDILRRKYDPLIMAEVSSFASSQILSRDDLIEEAERALMRAAITFNPEKNVSFGYYAKRCVRNSMISLRRQAVSRQKKTDAVKEPKRANGKSILQIADFDTDYDEFLVELNGELSAFEKSVFYEYAAGRKPREISVILNTSVKSVCNAIFRIRQKAKKIAAGKKKTQNN